MRQIKEDDKVRCRLPLFLSPLLHPLTLSQLIQVIESEGLSALSLTELQAACQSRGIRTINVSEEHLRSELAQWVDLHLNRGLSGTLLILSKAFAFNKGAHGDDQSDEIMRSLKDTLASLPDNLVRCVFASYASLRGSLNPSLRNAPGQRNRTRSFFRFCILQTTTGGSSTTRRVD